MKKKDLYYERIPTKLLREDVRYLGNILGKVIKLQEGIKFFHFISTLFTPVLTASLKCINDFSSCGYESD